MSRQRFDEMNCGIGRALEAFGDWWSLLIIRDAFYGSRRFAHFQRSLGIATNVLTKRLEHLVAHEILERVEIGTHGERYEYRLTAKGRGLLPVLTAIRDWSDAWVFGRGNEPVIVRDRHTGRRVPPVSIRNAEGQKLGLRDLVSEAGPGANEDTRQRLRASERAQRRAATR